MKRDMLNRGVCILLMFVLFAACKARKPIVAAVPNADSAVVVTGTQATDSAEISIADKLAAIQQKQVSFTTLSGKAKAALSIGTNSNDVTMNIRIKNNEAIWVSVTAIAGLEVARALITPDSVRVINRLENVYIKKPFTYLYEFTNNKINFATLQAVFLGNVISGFVSDSTEINLNNTETELTSNIGSMLYKVMLNDQSKVVESNLSDKGAGQSLFVSYGDFQLANQQYLPYSMVMKSQAKSKNISLDLKYSKIELDLPIDIPFRVPDRYTVKN